MLSAEPTYKIELELPGNLATKEPNQLQRTMIHHLLLNDEIVMADALALLSQDDLRWLIESLLQDAQDALFLADTVTDPIRRQQFWIRYKDCLELLFGWHEQWSRYHNHLLSLLHTTARRYSPEELKPERTKLLLRLTQQLSEETVYQEDVFAAKRGLSEVGLDTTLDLAPVAEQLFASYVEELSRD